MTAYSLMTLAVGGRTTGCIEVGGRTWTLAGLGDGLAADVAGLFADWPRSEAALTRAAEHLAGAPVSGETLAPLLYPGKIMCAGANYYDHLKEMGVADTRKEAQRLFFFMKPPRNAVVGPGRTVRMPIDTKMFDWEVELAAVIGKRARAVSEAQALDHVAAYTVGIDFSARDLNRAPETFYKLDWVAGKAHDTCCPLGPRLVPAAQIGDPQNLGLKLSVNGEVQQDARTSGMIFSLAEQIARASRIMTLDPGDVILTGTPAGVGVPRGKFLKPGDRVDAEIEKIGTLSVEIMPPDA